MFRSTCRKFGRGRCGAMKVAGLVVALSLVLTLLSIGDQAHAQDAISPGTVVSAVTGVLKATQLLTGLMYKMDCTGPKAMEDWTCQAFGIISGEGSKKELKEWRKSVSANLTKISNKLDTMSTRLDLFDLNLRKLITQYQILELQLEELEVFESARMALLDLAELRLKFDEHIKTVAQQPDPEAILRFGQNVVKANVPHLIFTIHSALVSKEKYSTLRTDPSMLQLWIDEMLVSYRTWKPTHIPDWRKGVHTLASYYNLYEMKVADVLAKLNTAHAIYLYGAGAVEAECELNAKCQVSPENSVKTYDERYARFRKELTDEFTTNVERMVLALSDSHHREPNFLLTAPYGETTRADDLFARADLFASAVLNQWGIRGRVITAGDKFDGILKLQSRVGDKTLISDINPVDKKGVSIPSVTGKIDWWLATSKAGVYDQFHFADDWKVFRYFVAEKKPARYTINRFLPYKTKEFKLDKRTGADGSTMYAGSFTAIERAGGGYALLSGNWKEIKKKVVDQGDAAKKKQVEAIYADAQSLSVGVVTQGRIEYTGGVGAQKAASDLRAEAWEQVLFACLQNEKAIRVPETTKVRLFYYFDAIKSKTGFSENNETLLSMNAWFNWSYNLLALNHNGANFNAATGIYIGNHEESGMDWQSKLSLLKKYWNYVLGKSDSISASSSKQKLRPGQKSPTKIGRITTHLGGTMDAFSDSAYKEFKSGKKYSLELRSSTMIKAETSGYDATRYNLVAGSQLVNAYIVPQK